RQDADDRHGDHQLDQGKTSGIALHGVHRLRVVVVTSMQVTGQQCQAAAGRPVGPAPKRDPGHQRRRSLPAARLQHLPELLSQRQATALPPSRRRMGTRAAGSTPSGLPATLGAKGNTVTISVILPAKNEAEGLRRTLPALRSRMPEAEIIVVDDGSTDDTAAVATGFGARVLSSPYSMGNGAAIKRGARAAGGDVLVFMDADGQHDPACIEGLLEKLGEGYDMVVGARDWA